MAVAGNIVIEMAIDDKMSVSVKRAGTVLQEFQGILNKTASSSKRLEDANESLGTKFRHLVVTLGNLRFVAMDVNDIFLRLPTAIMKTAGELERTQALLGGLSKELTKAARDAEAASNFKYITTMAQSAPFAISALSDAFVKFKSAGIDPTNGSMRALVDGVAKFGGNGESLHRASIAIQQMAGKGVVSMEELRQQLGEAVPTAMQDMATGMGMSMADLTKAVSKGTVEANDAINKMLVVMGQNNEGAAKNMMDTWVGVQAQLKTRMELAAKEIADAGFGDATKKVAREISTALESIEFKQFAEGTGAVLADTVEKISTLVKLLIEYGDYIKIAAEAWIAYKIATAAVVPVGAQIISQVKSVNSEYKNQQAILSQTAATARASAMTQTSAAVDTARAQMTASADTIAVLKKELAAHEERRAVIQRNFADTSKSLQSYQPTGAYGGLDRAAVQEYQRNLARLDAENAATMRRIRGEIDLVSNSHAEAARNVLQHGTHLDQLANQSQRAGTAMTAMSTAGRMAGNVFNLLGGWATVLNIAIAAGIALWFNWGKAAEDAAARARRAKASLADKEDVKGLENDRYNANNAARFARDELEAMDNNRFIDKKGKMYLDQQAKVARLEAAAREVEDNLSKAKISAAKINASEEAQTIVRLTDNQIDTLKKEKTKALIAQDELFKEEMRVAGANKAMQDAARKRNKDARMDIDIEFGGKTAGVLSGQIDKLTAEFNGPKGDAALEAAGILRDKLTEAQDSVVNAVNGKGDNKILNGKTTGAPKDSPITKVAKQLAEDRARLSAELANFDETKGEVDKVAGIVSEMNQKLLNGELNDKSGKKPSDEKFKELVNAAIVNQRLREVAKQREEDATKAASDLQKATGFIEGMRPDVEAAMELLANPMGTAMRGANESKVERWIAKNTDAIQRYAEQQKITVEKVKQSLTNDATFVDVMKTFGDVENETRRINASIVTDDRNSAVARMNASNAEYALKLRNLINLRVAAGASKSEIDALEKLAADNAIARANEVHEKSKSPIEKMAEQWKNSSKNMEEATARWANSSVDAFVEMAKTGKMEWSSLADSIVSDILRIMIQKQMADAIMGASSWISSFFFADGGIMTGQGSMPLKKYAAGGIARSPQMAVFGEGSMPEAYVPLPDGRSIPVTMKGGGGGGGGNMVVNIIEAPGKGGETAARQENGVNIMDIMVEKVSNKIAGDITRGSGAINGAITSTFGLNRVAGAY